MGKNDKRTAGEQAVDEFKGQRQDREDKVKLMSRANDILAKVLEDRAAGLIHFADDGTELTTPEAVLAQRLAGRVVTTLEDKPDDDKPMVVTKTAVQATK